MLRQLTLRNFRTHKKTKLDFCSGLNGIIGISSSGKTNILRALKLIFTNRPLGDGVISRFAKEKKTTIVSKWSGAGTIKMVKGKDSYYQINDEGRFRKFGTAVPDAVTDALFLSSINFHGQFEGPFLIFSGPGEISKYINKVTGAESFDTWTSNVNNRIRNIKYSLGEADFRIEKYRLEKEKLAGINTLNSEVKELRSTTNRIEKLKADYEEITELHGKLISFNSKVLLHKKVVRFEVKIKRIKELKAKRRILEEDVDIVDDLIVKKEAQKSLVKAHKKLMREYIKQLKKDKRCPTCFSPIKQSTIKRLKREIHLS